jgi:hypothetical protein
MTICAYPFVPDDFSGGEITLEMPEGAAVVAVDTMPDNRLCLFAWQDEERPAQTRKFRVYRPGEAIPATPELEYVGHCLFGSGPGHALFVFEPKQV